MKNIFEIPIEDIQRIARKKTGRDLTIEELEQVKKGVEWGFVFWDEVVINAIDELENN